MIYRKRGMSSSREVAITAKFYDEPSSPVVHIIPENVDNGLT